MANNYIGWCIGIHCTSYEEEQWFKTTISDLNEFASLFQEMDAEGNFESSADKEEFDSLKEKLGEIADGIDEDRDFVSFKASWDGKIIYLSSDYQSSDPGEVELLIQSYLKRFHPNESISLSWASWCDKNRDNEFGGGGVFITADSIKHINSWDWLSEQRAKFKKKKKK